MTISFLFSTAFEKRISFFFIFTFQFFFRFHFFSFLRFSKFSDFIFFHCYKNEIFIFVFIKSWFSWRSLDECTTGTHTCSRYQPLCTDTDGSFYCSDSSWCPESRCSNGLFCLFTPGSHICKERVFIVTLSEQHTVCSIPVS